MFHQFMALLLSTFLLIFCKDSAVQIDAAPSPSMLNRLHTAVDEHVKRVVMSALPSTYITTKKDDNEETAEVRAIVSLLI